MILLRQMTITASLFLMVWSFLYLKLPTVAIENLLWAEDGNIFINGANSGGFKSIINPYAGYLLIMPRLVAYFASFFDPLHIPLLYLVACIFFIAVFIFSAYKFISNYVNKKYQVALIIFLILIQPNNGEIYFNLTNIQWFSGLALIFLLLNNNKIILKNLLILLFSLTGPFIIFIYPLYVLKQIYLDKFKFFNRIEFLILTFSLLIQLFFLVNSDRVSNIENRDFYNWVNLFIKIFTFNIQESYYYLFLFFWPFFGILLFKRLRNLDNINYLILLLLYGLSIILISAITSKGQIDLIGSRYYFITLSVIIIFVFIILSINNYLFSLIFSLFLVVFIGNNNHIPRVNNFYNSYIALSKAVPNIVIPINPFWDTFPGWFINIKNQEKNSSSAVFNIPLDSAFLINGNLAASNTGFTFRSNDGDPYVVYNVTQCENSKHVGVVFKLNRDSDGPAQLFWFEGGLITEKNSISRYYPSGYNEMQYAFPRPIGDFYLRFDPIQKKVAMKIESLHLYCL